MLRENMIVGLEIRIRDFSNPRQKCTQELLEKNFRKEGYRIVEFNKSKSQIDSILRNNEEVDNFCSADGNWARSELIEPWSLTKGLIK